MIQNRDRFLENVAKNLGRRRLAEKPQREDWDLKPQWNVFQNYSSDQLVEELKNQCLLIHTDVIETTKKELAQALNEAIARNNGNSIVTWKDPRFVEFGLMTSLEVDLPMDGIEVHQWNPDIGAENIKIAERADVGITFSDITLAESATVVLFSGEGKGRSVSLLPTTYIAIIPKSTIVPRLTQAAAEINRRLINGENMASCINFITGPSNSADIEMSLVVGVHGPIKATYIVVDDA